MTCAWDTGMHYMPEPDTFYLDTMLEEKQPLPVDFNGMCSLEKFYTDPKAADGNSYRLQLWMYNMRLLYYANAIEHLLSTGNMEPWFSSEMPQMLFVVFPSSFTTPVLGYYCVLGHRANALS